MRFINTKTHGILDYVIGLLLIIAPWALGFAQGGIETWLPVLIGAGTIVYSMFTNYEYGVVRKIPMGTHLTIDLLAGILLAVSPWLFGFAEYVFWPHLIVGLLEIGAALTTHRVADDLPEHDSRHMRHAH